METQIQIDPLLFSHLSRVADGIVKLIGPCSEVVVHDFSDLEHSIIYISGNLTGRKTGAPIPDISILSEKIDQNIQDQYNYITTIGDRTFHSTTIWIRDNSNRISGALCINIDYSNLALAHQLLGNFLLPTLQHSNLVKENTFAQNPDHLIELSIKNFLLDNNIDDINQLNQDEKIRIVKELEEKGIFSIRSAAEKLANLLNVSRASIYNYRSVKQVETTK